MDKQYKVGLFPMVGDLLHVGHIQAIHYAKQFCDVLIVAMNCDPRKGNPSKRKPVESIYERFRRIESHQDVDKVIPYEGEKDLELLLQTTQYDVRFVGDDHLSKRWSGQTYEEHYKIPFIAVPRRHTMSSTNLVARIQEVGKSKKEPEKTERQYVD